MLGWLTDTYDGLFDLVAGRLSIVSIIGMFWFFFFIEVPRYYLLDMAVVLYRKLNASKYRHQEALARFKLQCENPLVTIIVPGKNEGSHIYKLTQSLKEQTYKNYKLIIIDDGSDDWTPVICRNLEEQGLIDRYLRAQVRGGKASAANLGLYYAEGKYVIHLDADSSLDRDAIEQILVPFYISDKIKAVGGCVKVRNGRDNLCSSLQALEYLQGIMVGRIVTSTLGIYRIVSGAFGAFETKTLHQVGGWDIGPGLDGDITQKIRKAGGKIHFEPKAVCLTNSPTSFRALSNQRSRWSKSLVRFRLRKHIDVLYANKNFSFSNFFSSLENIVFSFLFDITWLIYVINLIFSNTDILWQIFALKFFISMFFSFISFGMIMLVTERKKEEAHLARFVPFMGFYEGMYLRVVRIYAYFKEIFFFSSYKDSWNPRKTSDFARVEKM